MRYAAYFFLFLSGFFYLTGKPMDDKAAQSPTAGTQGKFSQLKYARRTSTKRNINYSAGQSASAKPKMVKADGAMKIVAVKDQPKPVEKPVMVEKTQIVAEAGSHWLSSTRQADKNLPVAIADGKSTYTGSLHRSGSQAAPSSKAMDWTVFGNNRDSNSGSVPRAKASQDVLNAERRRADAADLEDANKPTGRLAAKKRKNKSKKYARLKRKNKGAFRIARRDKKKLRKKVSNRPRRKTFGFSSNGVGTSLGSF
jgi:hypothetical protein